MATEAQLAQEFESTCGKSETVDFFRQNFPKSTGLQVEQALSSSQYLWSSNKVVSMDDGMRLCVYVMDKNSWQEYVCMVTITRRTSKTPKLHPSGLRKRK